MIADDIYAVLAMAQEHLKAKYHPNAIPKDQQYMLNRVNNYVYDFIEEKWKDEIPNK